MVGPLYRYIDVMKASAYQALIVRGKAIYLSAMLEFARRVHDKYGGGSLYFCYR